MVTIYFIDDPGPVGRFVAECWEIPQFDTTARGICPTRDQYLPLHVKSDKSKRLWPSQLIADSPPMLVPGKLYCCWPSCSPVPLLFREKWKNNLEKIDKNGLGNVVVYDLGPCELRVCSIPVPENQFESITYGTANIPDKKPYVSLGHFKGHHLEKVYELLLEQFFCHAEKVSIFRLDKTTNDVGIANVRWPNGAKWRGFVKFGTPEELRREWQHCNKLDMQWKRKTKFLTRARLSDHGRLIVESSSEFIGLLVMRKISGEKLEKDNYPWLCKVLGEEDAQVRIKLLKDIRKWLGVLHGKLEVVEKMSYQKAYGWVLPPASMVHLSLDTDQVLRNAARFTIETVKFDEPGLGLELVGKLDEGDKESQRRIGLSLSSGDYQQRQFRAHLMAKGIQDGATIYLNSKKIQDKAELPLKLCDLYEKYSIQMGRLDRDRVRLILEGNREKGEEKPKKRVYLSSESSDAMHDLIKNSYDKGIRVGGVVYLSAEPRDKTCQQEFQEKLKYFGSLPDGEYFGTSGLLKPLQDYDRVLAIEGKALVGERIHGDFHCRNIAVIDKETCDYCIIDFADMQEDAPISWDFAKLEMSLRLDWILAEQCSQIVGAHDQEEEEVVKWLWQVESRFPKPQSNKRLEPSEGAPKLPHIEDLLNQHITQLRRTWYTRAKDQGLRAREAEVDYYASLYFAAIAPLVAPVSFSAGWDDWVRVAWSLVVASQAFEILESRGVLPEGEQYSIYLLAKSGETR